MFNPRDYLNTYYTQVDSENHALLEFWRHYLPVKISDDVLDIGCGPTLFTAIPIITRCRTLTLADALPENIAEIALWKTARNMAFSWDPIIDYYIEHLDQENSKDEIEHALMTKTKTRVMDVYSLDKSKKYDVITAAFLLEAAAEDRTEFKSLFHQLTHILKPGGIIALATALFGNDYEIGNICLPMANISELECLSCYILNEFTDVRYHIIPISDYRGYNKIMVVWGRSG